MRENKLQIRIEARADQFQQAVNRMVAEAKAAGANVSQSLESAGKGADSLGKSVIGAAGSFDQIGRQGADALSEIGQEADQAGQEVRGSAQAMERALAALAQEAADLRRELQQVGDSSAEIEQLKKDLQQLESELRDTGDAAGAINFQTALDSADKILSKLQEVTSSFSAVADESRKMERDIRAAFSDPKQANEMIAAAKELKDQFGDLISEEDIGQAIKRLDTLQAASKENLGFIAKLAIDSGKDLEGAADDLGEFLAPVESGIADFAILGESLRSSFGLSAQQIREFGLELDENGKIVADTVAQQRKAQEALKEYLRTNERFDGIASRNKDSTALFGDELSKFQRTVGESINEIKNFVAEALLPMLKRLNESPETFKKVTAGVILLLTPLIALGKILSSIAGLFGKLGGSTTTAVAGMSKAKDAATGLGTRLTSTGQAMKTFGTSTAGSALALVGLAKAAYDAAVASNEHLDSVEQLDKAETALVQTLSKVIREEEAVLKIRKLSTDQIAEEAKKFEEYATKKIYLTLAVVEATDRLRDAEASGDEAAIKSAQERLQNVFNQRKEVQVSHQQRLAQIEEEKKAQEQSFANATSAYRKFKKDYERGLFQSKEIALSSLQAIADGLSGQSQQNALAEVRKLQGEVLKEKLDRLNKEVEAERTSVEKAKAIQAGLLRTYGANLDVRRDAVEKLAETEAKVNDKRLKAEQKLQADKIALEKSAIQQRAALASDSSELATLERRLDKGEDVVDQIKREATAQNEKLKGYVEELAAIERIAIAKEKAAAISADPRNADDINAQAAERLRQLNAQVAADQDRLDRDLAEKKRGLDEKRAKLLEQQAKDREAQLKAEAEQTSRTAALRLQVLEEERAGQEEVFQQRRRHLEELAAAGQDVSRQQQQLLKDEVAAQEEAIKRRLQLQEQEIKAKQSQDNVGATKEQQELNAKQASLAIDKAQREARKELQGIIDQDTDKLRNQTKELERQRDVLKEQNEERKKAAGFEINSSFGGVSGVEGINSFGGGFGERRQPKTEDGQSVEDIDRQIARNKVKLAENSEKSRKTDSAFSDGQAAKPGSSTGLGAGPTDVNLPPQVIGLFQQMANNVAQSTQATNNLVQTIRAGQNKYPAGNAGAMFAEGGTRLPGNPL